MQRGYREIHQHAGHGSPSLDFAGVLLAGLARDGGLYIPENWPRFSRDDLKAMAGLSYAELACQVMKLLVGDALSSAELEETPVNLCRSQSSRHSPLVQLGDDMWLMELFHGPTLAFKDYALQLVGRLFDRILSQRDERVTIVGATSGDTGSAAIESCRGRDRVDIFILHPHGRVSEVQRRQMTTGCAPPTYRVRSHQRCKSL